ncbi:Cullin repeat-like-containing domain superfamily [Arabidopsis suecica]|uniref:Exocyst subunit Exo70 family protein n=1 Tax=Arabidopsis suecica TaxID=45249 RepID=A0A8T1ZTK6_ARASU|nr:Cullin repeat-like-containing domain superfamily [Arabidopsis suecica]
MGEFEVDGEEKLIVAAKYVVKELRSGKSLTKNAKKVLGNLLLELSRVVIAEDRDEEDEIGEIEQRLNVVSDKIMTREVDESMIWDLGQMKVICIWMLLPFELEHSSFRSVEADHGVEEEAMASFGAASTEDLILGSNNDSRRNSGEIVVDLINPDVISDLKNIATTMIASGYDRECIQVEKLSIEDVLRMDWATLNTNIKKWVRVVRNIVQIYLLSEKSLDNQIFGDLNEIGLTCFVDTVKAPMMQLLNFGEAVSLGPRQPEKLLRILEMYELASELLPEIDDLFSDHPGSSIRTEYREVMKRLGDCARTTFLEFKSAIASDVSSHPFPGGAVHPLTNYVMNYLMALTDFSHTLDSLLMETTM